MCGEKNGKKKMGENVSARGRHYVHHKHDVNEEHQSKISQNNAAK